MWDKWLQARSGFAHHLALMLWSNSYEKWVIQFLLKVSVDDPLTLHKVPYWHMSLLKLLCYDVPLLRRHYNRYPQPMHSRLNSVPNWSSRHVGDLLCVERQWRDTIYRCGKPLDGGSLLGFPRQQRNRLRNRAPSQASGKSGRVHHQCERPGFLWH